MVLHFVSIACLHTASIHIYLKKLNVSGTNSHIALMCHKEAIQSNKSMILTTFGRVQLISWFYKCPESDTSVFLDLFLFFKLPCQLLIVFK